MFVCLTCLKKLGISTNYYLLNSTRDKKCDRCGNKSLCVHKEIQKALNNAK